MKANQKMNILYVIQIIHSDIENESSQDQCSKNVTYDKEYPLSVNLVS